MSIVDMSFVNLLSLLLVLCGALFFFAGTVGLVRFPDVFSRLHALTKADNLGLGFIVLGLALQVGSGLVLLKLVLIWLLAVLASSVSCHLIARHALRGGAEVRGLARRPEA
jgi:multicomponent Na+:H+ antiporter subunit G